MGTTFTYNNVDYSNILTVNNVSGRGVTPSELDTLSVPGMVGVHPLRKKRKKRVIEIEFTIEGGTADGLRDVINSVNESLDLDEVAPLVFSDEADKMYYAIMTSNGDSSETRSIGKGTLTFLCPDPYKYGPEQTAILNTATGAIINASGTAPTNPIFELDVTQDTTYILVSNDKGDYMMLGQPYNVDQSPFIKYEQILLDDASSLVGWATANAGEIDGTIAGAMTSNGYRFQTTDYGTGTSRHGPAIKTSLSQALTDFRLEGEFTFANTKTEDIGRAEIYLLDASGGQVCKISIRDRYEINKETEVDILIKGARTHYLVAETGDNGVAWNDFKGILRIEREGDVWSAYVAQVDPVTGKHTARRVSTFIDNAGEFTRSVAQVVVHTSQHTAYQTPLQGVDTIYVYKINQDLGVPYIAKSGDKVIFNHQTNELLINGEPVKKLKDFGATYFNLSPGENTIAVLGAGNGVCKYKPAYK